VAKKKAPKKPVPEAPRFTSAQQQVIDHVGGPMLAGAVAGAGKCVRGDTLVATDRGVCSIEEAGDCRVLSVNDKTLSSSLAKATWMPMGSRRTLRIVTSQGYRLHATPEHPLLLWTTEGSRWRRTDELRRGDHVFMQPGYDTSDERRAVSDDEAYLLGLLTGDGRVNKIGYNTVRWSRGGVDLPPIYYDLVRKLYGVAEDEISVYRKKGLGVDHGFWSPKLGQRLVELDWRLDGSARKRLPAWIMTRAGRSERIAFLRGYFDTDGYCAAGHGGFEVVSASEELVVQVHQILLGLGIVGRLGEKPVAGYEQMYWRITITGVSLRRFREIVGFGHERTKQRCLDSACAKPTNTNIRTYPYMGRILSPMRTEWRDAGRWNGHRQALDGRAVNDFVHNRRSPSQETLRRMAGDMTSESANLLRAISEFFLDKIESVTPDQCESQVYDLSVPGNSSFVANGFVAHNSTTLVERVAKLHAGGTPLQRIMLSAFNVDAAADLNRKLKKRLNMRGQEVEVARTLHGLAHAIWKSSPTSDGFGLDKGGSTYGRAIRQGANAIGVDKALVEVDVVSKFASKVKNDCLINSFVTGLRALGQTPGELVDVAAAIVRKKKDCATTPARLLDIYFAAEDARTTGTELPDGTRMKFVTFDDLLSEAARLLAEDDAFRSSWQERFDYVILDEAQDLCEAQWRIANALAERHQNIVITGDPGQAIYTFRGARPENFLGFDKTWSNTRRVYMDANFRSGHDIIRVANVVLDKIPEEQKLPMRLQPTRPEAGFVGYRETDDPRDEARDIAINIQKHKDAGVEWRDQAILVRRNDQSGVLELALLKAKIPARIVRGHSFFASREAKTALAYLRLIANRADEDDFETAIMNPPKYLGRVFIDKILFAWQVGLDWLDVMDAAPIVSDRRYNGNARDFMGKIRELRLSFAKGATPLQLFTKVCEKMNWDRWVGSDLKEASPDNDAAMNFDRVRDFLSDFDDLPSLLTTIDELKTAQRAAAASRNAVAISTAHGCKGLEYQIVYIAGMVDKIWPTGWSGSDLVDERRVFYVAVTRARDELWFMGYRFKDSEATEGAIRSPYLDELGMQQTDRVGRQSVEAGQMALLTGAPA
jgi:superfamily I DNA/RNA helicase